MGVISWLTLCAVLILVGCPASFSHEVTYSNVMSATRNFGGLDPKSLSTMMDNVLELGSMGELLLQEWKASLYKEGDRSAFKSLALSGNISKNCISHLNATFYSLIGGSTWAIQSK